MCCRARLRSRGGLQSPAATRSGGTGTNSTAPPSPGITMTCPGDALCPVASYTKASPSAGNAIDPTISATAQGLDGVR
ncbi:hypothetical protein AL037_06480 [Salipiger aestuarii]|nr:hypothetical protein AL037_06480 [Salipiger aestuarii]